MKFRITEMYKNAFDLMVEWLDENEVDYLATEDNDIILNFKDMRIDYIDGDQVRIYIDKHNRHEVFELDSTEFVEIKIF